MVRVELAPGVGTDIERIMDHIARHEAADAPIRIREIIEGVSVLEHHPLMGRPAPEDLRALIIGRDARGYVALYRYLADLDIVFVLAIRGQRDAGYKRP